MTAFEPDALATYSTVGGKLKFSATSRLEPADGGTRCTYRVEAESGLAGVFGKLSDPLSPALSPGPSAPIWEASQSSSSSELPGSPESKVTPWSSLAGSLPVGTTSDQ